MVNIETLASQLEEQGKNIENGFLFEVNPIPGEVEVLQIIVEDREELPIFVSTSEEQILCIAYLFKNEEIKKDKIDEMNKAMLATNISMPLSSFALVDEQYVIFGALSVNSSLEDVIHEIEILSSNTTEAIEAMSEYLV
ncbi:MAG: DUF2170 family protein [Pseudomonadota bacterium]